jgi:hypothetical protein
VAVAAAWLSGLPVTREHRRFDVSGPDSVDPHPDWGRLQRGSAGQADDSLLAGHIQRQIGKTLVAEHRCDVDDRTAALVCMTRISRCFIDSNVPSTLVANVSA